MTNKEYLELKCPYSEIRLIDAYMLGAQHQLDAIPSEFKVCYNCGVEQLKRIDDWCLSCIENKRKNWVPMIDGVINDNPNQK